MMEWLSNIKNGCTWYINGEVVMQDEASLVRWRTSESRTGRENQVAHRFLKTIVARIYWERL